MSTVAQSFELAVQHHQSGRLTQAESLYRQILAVHPHHADALHMLGVIALQAGHAEAAAQLIRQAISLAPNNPMAHCNLGLVCRARRECEEAIACYERAIQLKPDYAEAHNNLGISLAEMTRLAAAVDAFRRALQFNPSYLDAWINLGNALKERGQLDEAIAAYHRALALSPDSVAARYNFGNALRYMGQLDEALATFHRALEIAPGDLTVLSSMILSLSFKPGDVGKTIADAQNTWNRRCSDRLKPLIQPHRNDRAPERRLRVGYVSPDFREHVVARNLLPLFRNHQHDNFEIFCYSGVAQADATTAEFQKHADHWRNAFGMTDEALADAVRRDGIDILVDLSQHTCGNRLSAFARQPAPVQVSFAGYPESTGVEAIRYRISDRWLERERGRRSSEIGVRSSSGNANTISDLPSSISETRPAEQVYLLDSFWCYDPCGIDLPVNPLPALENGSVTFGSLNSFIKVNEPVLKLWGRVLAKVPNSRLVLLSDPGTQRQWVSRVFEEAGIEPQRVEFVPRLSRAAYCETYHRIDIILDPFPYGGHTTSLDALWMGVAVVSLAGQRAVSRAGLSQMSNLGLGELVAFSEDEYLSIAESLAGDLPRLAELRRTLRSRMQASVLMDAPHFARQIEAAYRAMWRQWCAGNDGIR
ncbi:MAG TPA: tetratricopeptide repeat protein [Chthoniobacter sp.]